MRDAGLEVVLEASDGARQSALVVGDQPFRQLTSDGPAGGLISGRGPGLELGPEVLGHLGRQIAHAVGQAALTLRSREAGLDRLDDPRGPVGDEQQRVAQAA